MSDEDEKDQKAYEPEDNDNEIEESSKKNQQKNDENIDNQEDYNDEEDENYIEEEKPKKKKKQKQLGKKRERTRKKKKKKQTNDARMFFEKEAEEDENDEDSYYEEKGELTKEQQKEEMAKAMKQTSHRFEKITDENEENFLEHIQEINDQHQDELKEEEVNRRPTNADPKMWIVKCRIGDEKEILENLYHKYFYFKDKKKDTKERVRIFSITAFENLKGKIFIEAFTERDVVFAIQDMTNVNQNSIQLVPINERMQIFEYDQAPKSEIYVNQLVRVKGGNYDGDLAKVVYVEDPVNKIHIALVPRIIDDPKGKKGFNVASFGRQKSFLKPRKKLFDRKYLNDEDKEHFKQISEPYGETYKFGSSKFREGLLIKIMRRMMLETENVSPKEDELQKIGCYIDENGVYIDKYTNARLIVANKTNIKFNKGDLVKIACDETNELNNVEGTVVNPECGNNEVEIKIIEFKNEDNIYKIPKSQLVLVKHNFKNGDLVYAKYGNNKGRSGMVVNAKNDILSVYDDVTKTYFEAKNSDLIFSVDMELDNEENEMFKIGELVQLKNSNTVCYIIESTKFIIRVVSTSNEVKKMSVREVDKITLPKKATCIDGKGNPLDLDNTVKVIKGQYKGFKGVIKAIYRKFVFLLNYDFTRTNGIFCEIKENLELLGSELLLESNDKGRVNHRRIPNEIKDLMGKTVHVIKGIWKGYNGILKEGNDKNVKLELIAKQKTVELPFDHILKGDVNSVKENNDNTSFNNRQFMKTPAYYEQHKDAWE